MADECAVADDRPAPDEHTADRADGFESFVRGVVAGVMQVDGVDRPSCRGVEQDEVGVTARFDGPLARSNPKSRAGVVARTSTMRSIVSRPAAPLRLWTTDSRVSIPGAPLLMPSNVDA